MSAFDKKIKDTYEKLINDKIEKLKLNNLLISLHMRKNIVVKYKKKHSVVEPKEKTYI